MERRLAAILAADVVGYSRLMEADEEATARTLSTYREIIEGLVASHHGRVFGSAGDSVIAEFISPVEAVRCAVDIQRELEVHNVDLPEDRRMRLRIGVNLGDVMVEGDNLLGDGVNIAARLETLAEPGGICLSRTVRDQIRDKLDLVLDDLGEVEVKNIARPVRAFRVVLDDAAVRPTVPRAIQTVRTWRRPAIVVALVMLVFAAGIIVWARPWEADIAQATRTDQVGIAVLPFENMSGDPEQDYFSDGITEDVIADLSRISGLFVIARSTMFTYKGKVVGAQEVGRELGVPYVLEGSVRRAGERVRINAQLIDAANKSPLWADRYDRALTGVFELQDEVTRKIVAALAVKLTSEETSRLSRRARVNPEAYDTLLRGLTQLRRYTPEMNAEARELFEKALTLDPEYTRAYAAMAYTYAISVIFGWTKTPEEDGRQALELTRTALELDDTLPQVHFARSNAYRALRRLPEAIAAARRAIELDANYADAYAALAITLNYAGQPEDGIDAIRKSMRLNPRYSFFEVWVLAQGYYLLGRYEEAIAELQKVVESNPSFVQGHKLLAAAYGQSGKIEDAEWEAEEILTLLPDFSLEAERQRAPYEDSGLDHYINGLRKAGLSE
jgi:adenylate cyclase